jgi:hypothetical protein
MLDSTGPYLQFGDGAGGSETDMAIEHIAYDLSGAYGPATKNR